MLKLKIQLFADDPNDGAENDALEKQYLEQIAELKEQMDAMVSKEDYDKLLAEQKRLTNEFINKRNPPKTEPKDEVPLQELADKLLENKFKNNLDFIKTSLDYRQKFMKESGKDPWGDSGEATPDSMEVEKAFQSLVTEYGDNPKEFDLRFEMMLKDDPVLSAKLRNRKK